MSESLLDLQYLVVMANLDRAIESLTDCRDSLEKDLEKVKLSRYDNQNTD